MKNISGLTASELLDQYRSSELNPSEVVETCLARIDETNGYLHAVVTRCDEAARAASERSMVRTCSPATAASHKQRTSMLLPHHLLRPRSNFLWLMARQIQLPMAHTARKRDLGHAKIDLARVSCAHILK